eukprot:c12997_g1_i1 orf=207-2018(+)
MRAFQNRRTGLFNSIKNRRTFSNLLDHGHRWPTQTHQDMAHISSDDKGKLTALLRSHGKSKALLDGRLTHTHIVSCGYDHDTVVSNCVVQMYGSCGIVTDARATFDKSLNTNVYSWNLMINVYSQNGLLDDARELFVGMPLRDDVTWNAMIAACVQHGTCEEALCLFWSMQYDGIVHNNIAFVSTLDACTGNGKIVEGREIHATIICVGFEGDMIVGNALISFYGKQELVHDAHAVFSQMPHSDIVSWTAMLSAYVKVRNGHEALNIFCLMQSKGIKPDKIAHICALDACATLAACEYGQMIHLAVVESCSEQDVVVSTALINMYGECDNLHDAWNVFSEMPLRNVVSWTAMLAALSRNAHGKEALQLFHQMQLEGVNPNNVTLVFAVDACTGLLSVVDGQEIHVAVVIKGFEHDVAISIGLVNLYGKCSRMDDARRVFDRIPHKNVVAWSTMIASSTQNGYGKEALTLFGQMQGEGIKPNNVTFLCLVETCTSLAALDEGRALDKSISECGFGQDVTLGNALMNMYRKCGSLYDAEMVFDRMSYRNIVSWTSMIAALAQMGHGENAVVLFQEMLSEGINPDSITFTSILMACCHAGLVEYGR